MADRYWVGGSANWDGTAGTKWSTTSGGAGGASVPTSADAVFFTNLSTGTCTISGGNTGAQSINCTGHTGTITGTANITVSGSITLVAGQTFTYSGNITINGTGTLTTGGKTIAGNLDIANGTVTLGSALTSTGGFIVLNTNGALNTSASNFSVTASVLRVVATGNTLTLNGSTITLSSAATGVLAALTVGASTTLNAGTSTINLSSATAHLNAASKTFNNVSFTSTAAGVRLVGANTFSNLTLTAPNSGNIATYSFSGNSTITALVASGVTAVRRVFLRSDTRNTRRTLTVTTWSTISDVDFQDIGLNSSRSGTRLGNCGNNSNITFPAAKTVYWNLAGSAQWPATGWAASSGGTPDVNNFPLAQDTAVFDNTGAITGITVGQDWNIGTVNMSARTSAMTFTVSGLPSIYGNWLNGSGTTLAGSGTIYFAGATNQTITSNGKVFSFSIDSFSDNNTIILAGALTTSAAFRSGNSDLTLGNNTLTCASFANTSTVTRTWSFGTGNVTVTGTGALAMGINGTGLTVSGTPVINMTYAGAAAMTVQAIGLTQSSAISFNFSAGTYALTFSSSSSVRDLNFTGFAGNLLSASVLSIFGGLTLSSGMTVNSSVDFFLAATSGTRTVTSNGVTVGNVYVSGAGGTFQLVDALNCSGGSGLVLTNGTLNLNGQTATVTGFSTQAGTKNLTFNGGTLVVTASGSTAFNNAVPTGFTTTAGTGTGTIRMSGSSAKTFVGGSRTYNCTLDQGGAGALTITGANTFSSITNSYGATGATSILFTAGTTTTFADWNASGESGRLLTIGSVTAASHTLSKSSGTVNANFLSISRSNATGGADWYAGANSTDGGNNTGWVFDNAPGGGGSGNFLAFFM